ncbi:MAG: tRNA uridine-5-carboxymethylaminomethyl(34) synthesis GTPase MnmE [Clostridia bacterium]|nr:tRNA uridine-5-carboxymethylaminomethyl(34) synthesis GTPase MnmE [Clostridia bacterium]
MSEKTVAAISTAPGEGGIAVIRISGDTAIDVADKCFKSFSGKTLSTLKGYTALYGQVFFENTVIDDAVALVFLAPKSFTGENTVEISVHGGRLVALEALRVVLNCGAALAENGEFTKRAFLNGKLDLASAESIMEIISAKNETALKISRNAKNGRISKEIGKIIDKLLELAASFSVYSDYPDEEIENLNPETFKNTLSEIKATLKRLLDTYDTGKVIREGIDCSIVGKPNVGKSSLMNILCKTDRSIVTDVAGTTRDIVESTVLLDGITLILSDTAGIHKTEDIVEKAGVDRSIKRLKNSSLVIAVFDISRPFDNDDLSLIDELPVNAIIVLNKNDLTCAADLSVFKDKKTVMFSAKENSGIKELSKMITDTVKSGSISENDAVLISERQRNCANRAYLSICEAENAMNIGVTLDAVGVCIDDCLAALLELTGKRVTNEVTDEVFKRFCVGK